MNGLIKDKFRAASIHLLISLFLALICFLLVYLVWYPSPLVVATGVGGLFLMMLGIDLVLGPTFTFIVYKKFKKTLKFDLCVIAIIQLSAMIYGVYSMYEGRPVWIAFAGDRFELVKANDIVDSDVNYDSTIKNSSFGPKYIFVDMKLAPTQKLDMMLKEAQYGISPVQRMEYYKPFELATLEIRAHAQPLSILKEFNNPHQINSVLSQYPQATAWLPLKANAVDMVVLINQKRDEVIKIVDLRPWN